MRRRPAALRPPASSSSHQTGQPPRSHGHRVSVARTGEQASFRLKPMTSSLPTRQAGDVDQSSRPDGYERNQACSLATTPKLPESLSDRYSFWEFYYPPTNCIAKPGGASRTSARPTKQLVYGASPMYMPRLSSAGSARPEPSRGTMRC